MYRLIRKIVKYYLPYYPFHYYQKVNKIAVLIYHASYDLFLQLDNLLYPAFAMIQGIKYSSRLLRPNSNHTSKCTKNTSKLNLGVLHKYRDFDTR